MRITILKKDFKKEVKKQLKSFKVSDMYIFLTFNDDGTGNLRIDGYKNDGNSRLTFNTKIEHEGGLSTKEIVIDNLELTDVLFDMLLNNTYYIYTYHKNLKDIRIKNTDTEYWIDTIIVSNDKHTKKVKYDKIGFNGVSMIKSA